MLSKQQIQDLKLSDQSLEDMIVQAYTLGFREALQGSLDVCQYAVEAEIGASEIAEVIKEDVVLEVETNDVSA